MKKAYEVYNRIEKVILGLLMLMLIIVGFAQVICRFILKIPLAWAEELMSFAMVWVAYLGASAAANEKKHIMVTMFIDWMPKPLRTAFTVLSQVIWIACCGVMVYLGYGITRNYIIRGGASPGGKYPYWISAIIIPISMALIIIRAVVLIVQTIHGVSDTRSQEEIVQEEKEE